MTTIVYADGVLASDSQVTQGHNIKLPCRMKKIYEPEAGKRWTLNGKRILAIGVAGDAAGIYELISHLETGIMFDTKGKQDAWISCIAIADDKSIFMLDTYGDRKHALFVNLTEDTKYAIGSGGEIATAYLAIGKKAEDVIKLTSKLDAFTGGDVQVWRFPEVLPEDVLPVAPTKDQQDLINKVAGELDAIRANALEKATAEIIEKTTAKA